MKAMEGIKFGRGRAAAEWATGTWTAALLDLLYFLSVLQSSLSSFHKKPFHRPRPAFRCLSLLGLCHISSLALLAVSNALRESSSSSKASPKRVSAHHCHACLRCRVVFFL